MSRLYLSHSRLETWLSENRVTDFKLEKELVSLIFEGRTYRLKPAVRFLRIAGKPVSGAPDPKKLIGKVKEVASLAKEGGEHYLNSVIFGEVAYDVEQGFLGEPVGSS